MNLEFDFPDPCYVTCPLFQEAMDAAGIKACLPAAHALATHEPEQV